ncbi:hypothetical protein EDB86DRAFT_2955126 [Lactarius hatsudake]|nr:hypothetical protein EDB86DRAFT_2955126 [Lactarius hatsudake]
MFYQIPVSHVIARCSETSRQDGPGRTVIEIFLALFAIRTLLQSHTPPPTTAKSTLFSFRKRTRRPANS